MIFTYTPVFLKKRGIVLSSAAVSYSRFALIEVSGIGGETIKLKIEIYDQNLKMIGKSEVEGGSVEDISNSLTKTIKNTGAPMTKMDLERLRSLIMGMLVLLRKIHIYGGFERWQP